MNSSRRDFFKQSFSMLGLATILPLFIGKTANAEERRKAKAADAGKAGEPEMVKPGVGMAASVNYVANGKDVKDAKLKTERQGVAFEKQNCSGCMLYKTLKGAGDSEVGSCQLFPNQAVSAKGWCTSWAKKA